MLNNDFIIQKARESKIDSITVSREYWQLLLLQRLYLAKGSEKLFFKGGTAIRFLLNSFRFSEDLDFTSSGNRGEVELLIAEVFKSLHKTDSDLELRKERLWEKFAEESLKYRFLFLPGGTAQKVSIRLDISFREKPLKTNQTVLIPFDYPISPYPLVMHLGKQEILAEKIRALFVRGRPRDLFDLWFLLTKKVTIDKKIIQKKFKIYPGLNFSFEKLNKNILAYDEKEIKKDLNQFLPENYRHFYQKLKTETLGLLGLCNKNQ